MLDSLTDLETISDPILVSPSSHNLKPQKTKSPKSVTVADLFCGSGGFSTGAERAIESLGMRMDLSCVNHWDIAIASHKKNHPTAAHYCQDIATLRPIVAVPGGSLDLLLASPSCTYHSRARGSKPISDQQRMDPWHVITWLTELRVKRLVIENVPEFVDWGPVSSKTNRPIQSRKGEYFKTWVKAIRGLGFSVQFNVLTCADYGDATTRQRFFLIARSDEKKLNWPAKTHSQRGTSDLFGEGSKKWRGAHEIIDWTSKGLSIYKRKKPLSNKTMLRILSGIVRYEWHPGYANRLIQFMLQQGVESQDIAEIFQRSRPKNKPAHEVTSFVLNRHGDNGSVRAHDPAEPMPTADCRGAGYLVEPSGTEPFIAIVAHGDERPSDSFRRTKSIQLPVDTIHAGGGSMALIESGFVLSQASGGAPRTVEEPVPSIAGAGAVALIAPYYGSGSGETCRTTKEPLPALTTKGRFGFVTSTDEVIRDDYGVPMSVEEQIAIPSPEIKQGIILPLTHANGYNRSQSTDTPLPTITSANRGELGFLTARFGEREGQLPRTHGIELPIPTLCAQGGINLAMASHAQDDNYDILFRMLLVRELAAATSLDQPGKPYQFAGTKTEAIKQIGNAVPSGTAEALVAAIMAT